MKSLILYVIILIGIQAIAIGMKYFKILIGDISWYWIFSPSIGAVIIVAFIAFLLSSWRA